MKKLLFFILLSSGANAQVNFPHNAPSAGAGTSERVANFTVGGTGNDRLEIANGTQVDGQYIPTFWSYRDTGNTFSMVFTSSIAPNRDTGTSPLMLFTTTITPDVDFGAPGNGGDFVWGPSGTYLPIATRPLFEWRNSSAKLMTIIANGNVGIGTTTPTALFNTKGTVRFQDLANQTTPSFMLGTDANGNVFEYPVPTGGSGSSDADWLTLTNGVPMSINDNIYTNGFVGFNTQSPTANIHSKGTVRFQDLANGVTPNFMLGTDANGNVAEYPVPAGGTGGTPDADWLMPDNAVSYDINNTIYTNGDVGINVQNPAASLHVDGTLRFQNLPDAGIAAFMLGTDVNGNVAEYPVPIGGGGVSDADWLKPDGTLPMSIDDNIYTNGKVGINVTEFPELVGTEDVSFYNLFVTGGILTEEVRVALVDEWADYVFKEDYKLASLKEVEEHITKKGHLKNIPSEAEVKANGIELGEMDKLLLEKIEELTLYVIDLNKKVEEQKKEIEALKKDKR
jgi:hypothetical protein